MKKLKQVALWSSGMILASGARGPEFDSPRGPSFYSFIFEDELSLWECRIEWVWCIAFWVLLRLMVIMDVDFIVNSHCVQRYVYNK